MPRSTEEDEVMKKWPIRWLDVLRDARTKNAFDADILSLLDAVGALRPVPKPEERWVCDHCQHSFSTKEPKHGYIVGLTCPGTLKLFREVEDSDDQA